MTLSHSFPHAYMRQSTAESASSDSLDVGWSPYYACKRSIEEEEAEALAKVRSMVAEEVPHPPLSGLIPPNPEVLIHVQPSNGKKDEVGIVYVFACLFVILLFLTSVNIRVCIGTPCM